MGKVSAPKASPVKDGSQRDRPSREHPPRDSSPNDSPEVEQHARFKNCAESHGIRLHRIHVLSATKVGSFQSTAVFDCVCGQRWLLRIIQGDVVSVDTGILEELRRGREGQATAPPGFPGAPDQGRSPARKTR